VQRIKWVKLKFAYHKIHIFRTVVLMTEFLWDVMLCS